MLSKKYYIKIANILKKHGFEQDTDTVIQDFADMLEQDNSRFDRQRFYDYIKAV